MIIACRLQPRARGKAQGLAARLKLRHYTARGFSGSLTIFLVSFFPEVSSLESADPPKLSCSPPTVCVPSRLGVSSPPLGQKQGQRSSGLAGAALDEVALLMAEILHPDTGVSTP